MSCILSVKNIGMRFGGVVALEDVSMHLNSGEILGLIGANGSGKSTLFSIISGFLKPSQGEVFLDSKAITGAQPHLISSLGIRRTFQVVRPFESLTVFDNVVIGSLGHSFELAKARSTAEYVINITGLWDKRDVLCTSLPLLDRKRLEIARALAGRPRVLLLDEALSGLREKEIQEALNLIDVIQNEGVAILIVEHMMRTLMSLVDRVVVLSQGRIIANDTPTAIAQNKQVIESYLGRKYAAS